ncbi:TRAP transporter substrate-binding protein DctP [Salipiger abyssi]|uniref:TRAP-type C4-dicarboxylate transport system, periplasmic component n=1 Tax=Salipiger abyssi TaxID=1250539 RepID=A0A1P8V0S3_9RHOB|nr:TRAP transporter substrate-binding protein DctP [Salipiger abyssi]APZ55227.1 TRAP-type C4-dicarboxylate transport system, periplasmic component [Salipiger abyssi]
MKHIVTLAAVASVIGATLGMPVQAQETTKLKVASFLPESHHIVAHGTQVWMDAVTDSGAPVEFEFYPAQQAGKANQLLDLMTAGALDVVEIALGYYTDRFPLFGVVEMPGMYQDPCNGAQAIRSLASEGGVIYEGDIAPKGLHPLSFYVFPSYATISRQPIHGAEDFAGRKIRTAGGAMELEVSELGGVAVKMSSPEIMQSLSRGTIDGAMLTYLSSKQYELYRSAQYGTSGYSFGGAIVILMMTDRKYQTLSDEAKAAVDAAGVEAEQAYCSYAVEGNAEAMAFMKEQGVEIHEITEAEKAELDTKLASLADNWAAQLDQIGKPGAQALAEFRALLKSGE